MQLRRALGALDMGRGVVVVGDAGVGKTRLAREVLEHAQQGGHPVRWATASQAARTIAFGALAHLLPVTPAGASSPLNMLQRALHAIADLGRDRRLVLVVDDAHLLDDASSALVHLAASTADVLVVATSRAAGDTPQPLTALWKEELAERIELAPLAREETVDLAAEILGGALDERTAQLLWRTTLGNPLYLRELLLSGLDGGQLRRSQGLWRWRGELRPGSRLAEVIRSRLGDLGDELRATLEVVAVAQSLELALVERLCGEALLSEAERRGVVTVGHDGRRHRVELVHPLYAEVLRQGLPKHRVARIMGRLAAELEATGARRRGDLMRACDWRLEAGLPVPGEVLLAAATQARENGDWLLMERLVGAVGRERASDDARFVLAEALASVGRWVEADELLVPVDMDRLPDWAGAAVVAMRVDLLNRLNRVAEAEALLDRLAARPGGSAPWLPYCQAFHASLRGDFVAARAAIPADGGDLPRVSWSALPAYVHTAVAVASGDPDTALAVADRGLIDSETLPLHSARRSLLGIRLGAAVQGGYFEQAPLDSLYAASATGGDRLALWGTAVLASLVVLVRGDAAAARRWAGELSGLAAAIPAGAGLAIGHGMRARLLALVGETKAAEAALADMETARRGEPGAYDLELRRARCAVAAAGGDLRGARALALDGADRALELGQHMMVVHLGYDAARLGQVRAAAERVERVACKVTGPLLPVIARQVLAWSRSDGAAVDACSSACSELGAHLLAAEAAIVASWLHRDAGRSTAAAASGARAAVLLERCAGCRTPVIAASPRPSPLTPRELQIAHLAADGLSNQDAAARLGISRRTVETHLQRAYQKLGVSDRSGLAVLLGRGDAPAVARPRRTLENSGAGHGAGELVDGLVRRQAYGPAVT